MNPNNIRFLIIASLMIAFGIAVFIWSCKNSVNEYEKTLKRDKDEKKEYEVWKKRVSDKY